MDASDEFKFVVVSGRTRSGQSSAAPLQTKSSSVENLRSVPVCLYNTNKNLKLQFLWNRAFKLLHSHRTVYKAVSGIHYQNCGGTWSRSGTSRSGGISLRAKSLSHSHLSGLEEIMEQPGTSQDEGTTRIRSNNINEIAHHEDRVPVVPVPRKKTVCRSGGGRNTDATKQRLIASGERGEKPSCDEGRMDDNCISMGNNILAPLPVHLRRTQSTRSCGNSLDLSCHVINNDINNTPPRLIPPKRHKKLAKSQTEFNPLVSGSYSCSSSSSPCPDLGSSEAYGRGNYSDCSSEIVSNLNCEDRKSVV